jgi:plasmid maintenance system antidote protein VapI
MAPKKHIAEQLRKAILDSGISGYRLSRDAGVPQAVLSHFLRGKRSITIDTAAKLAAFLGLELRPRKRRQARKGKARKGR